MSESISPPASPGDSPPEVPDFRLLRLIGQGGFGRVWLAANRTTGRLRAVKVIPLRAAGTTDLAGREITSITRLEANLAQQHPPLLRIHHVGKTSDHLFYVMDLADDAAGGPGTNEDAYRPATLRSRLDRGPLPSDECLRCARQLLAALAFLHEAGMVHRDVKPANCLFVGGDLKLADFGLLTEAGSQVSRVGTEKYMPPDGRMDARADVYAAGLVIYEMVTGLPADVFPRPGDRAKEAVEDPTLGVLVRLALRACEPSAEERFSDARRMLADLERRLGETTAPRKAKSSRKWIGVGAAVVATALAAWAFWASRPERVHVNFVTRPFEAEVYLDGVRQTDPNGEPYKTPCTIDRLSARTYRVVFKYPGYGDLDVGPRDFARERRIEGTWSPRQSEPRR